MKQQPKANKKTLGENGQTSAIFGISGAKLTQEQLNLKIQLEARKACSGSRSGSRFTMGTLSAGAYRG